VSPGRGCFGGAHPPNNLDERCRRGEELGLEFALPGCESPLSDASGCAEERVGDDLGAVPEGATEVHKDPERCSVGIPPT